MYADLRYHHYRKDWTRLCVSLWEPQHARGTVAAKHDRADTSVTNSDAVTALSSPPDAINYGASLGIVFRLASKPRPLVVSTLLSIGILLSTSAAVLLVCIPGQQNIILPSLYKQTEGYMESSASDSIEYQDCYQMQQEEWEVLEVCQNALCCLQQGCQDTDCNRC